MNNKTENTPSSTGESIFELAAIDQNIGNMDMIDAAKTNNLMQVRLFVEQGADKDIGDSDGRTPLFMASLKGHIEVAQYLV